MPPQRKNLYIESADNGYILSYEDGQYQSHKHIALTLEDVRAFLELHFNTVTIPVMAQTSPTGT